MIFIWNIEGFICMPRMTEASEVHISEWSIHTDTSYFIHQNSIQHCSPQCLRKQYTPIAPFWLPAFQNLTPSKPLDACLPLLFLESKKMKKHEVGKWMVDELLPSPGGTQNWIIMKTAIKKRHLENFSFSLSFGLL